jgi:two-component system sensor histidine kinase ChiS
MLWIIRLNSPWTDVSGEFNVFVLGLIYLPLFYFSVKPLFVYFYRKEDPVSGGKARLGGNFSVLSLLMGFSLILIPGRIPWLFTAAQLFLSLGLVSLGLFIFMEPGLRGKPEKTRRILLYALCALGLLAVFLPLILDIPSFWFLGCFELVLLGFILWRLRIVIRDKGERLPLLFAGAELFLLTLALFIPLTGPALVLLALGTLSFLIPGESLLSRQDPVPAERHRPYPRRLKIRLKRRVRRRDRARRKQPVYVPPEGRDLVSGEAAEETAVDMPLAAAPYNEMLPEEADGVPVPVLMDTLPMGAEEDGILSEPSGSSPFVPRAFLDILKKDSVRDLKLGDHVMQEMTIFFSDIRQFTALLEALTPEQSFKFINSYLSRIVPVITGNGGFVDKYIGDAIMALFPQSDGPDRAVRSAIEIQRELQVYNKHRAKFNYRPLAIGVGIHMGTIMMGVVGVEDRMQNTVISDAVNQASRLEGMCKAYNVSILISEEIFKNLENPGLYLSRNLGRVKVKGRSVPSAVFEIYDGIDAELQDRKKKANRYWEEGIMSLYIQKNYADALFKFRKVREILPEDGAALYFTDLCMQRLKIS